MVHKTALAQVQPRWLQLLQYMVEPPPLLVSLQLLVIVYFLSQLGILTPEFLRSYRKHALVVVLIISAIITPPDIMSQIMVSFPLLILYEISIKISAKFEDK